MKSALEQRRVRGVRCASAAARWSALRQRCGALECGSALGR
jgi:hypothetical protein